MQSKELGPRAGLDLVGGGIGGRRRPDLAGGTHTGLLLALLGREVTLAGPAAASPGAPGGAALPCLRQRRLHGEDAARRTGDGLEATREEQGRDHDGEERVGRRWWWGKGAAAAALLALGSGRWRFLRRRSGGFVFWHCAPANDSDEAGGHPRADGAAWPAGPACARLLACARSRTGAWPRPGAALGRLQVQVAA
jgi:hypothetical protein